MTASSFLQVVARADNFSYDHRQPYLHSTQDVDRSLPLHVSPEDMRDGLAPLGWIRPQVIEHLHTFHGTSETLDRGVILIGKCQQSSSDQTHAEEDGVTFAYLAPEVARLGYEGITKEINALAQYFKTRGLFSSCLDGTFFWSYRTYIPLTELPVDLIELQVGVMNITKFTQIPGRPTFETDTLDHRNPGRSIASLTLSEQLVPFSVWRLLVCT